MIFLTFHILGIIFPTDELICFRGVEPPNQKPSVDFSKSLNKQISIASLVDMYLGPRIYGRYSSD